MGADIKKKKGDYGMKSNLNIRLIIDTDNNKTYLSIEGKTENATEEEKLELRETLVKALSQVIGIKDFSQNVEAEIVADFEPIPNETPDFITAEVLGKEHEKIKDNKEREKLQQKTDKSWENKVHEFSKQGKIQLAFPYEYKGLTAYQVLAKDGSKGLNILKNSISTLQKNIDRFPLNAKAIKEIKAAIDEYKKLKEEFAGKSNSASESDPFDRLVEEIKALGKEGVIGAEKVFRSRGTTFESVIKNKDIKELQIAYDLLMKALNHPSKK